MNTQPSPSARRMTWYVERTAWRVEYVAGRWSLSRYRSKAPERVLAELDALAGVAEHPGLAATAPRLATIMDDPSQRSTTPQPHERWAIS